ncbi:hypothetical protein OB955_17335 [Halobacteria archaeon AArc-m2/3/4]|uniref:Uncharacterized protein n=1 Tax=Natronoglomus mannanivorans TaxID=2979990 RepID=A0ABT2QHV2_9EURY|nr:hypothetical protein [Halobacteria archaeon AArc-m2/3/4]
MASEEHERLDAPFALPADVDDWIDEEAARRDESREAVCRRLVAAVHTTMVDDGEQTLPATETDLETLHARLDTQRSEFTDLLEDVRERVVQVKREADRKAPAAHAHDEYATADELRGVQASLADLERTTHTGFDNFEAILEGMVDDLDELDDRSTILANAIVELREHRRACSTRERRRVAVEELQLAANRLGVNRAACEECASDVTISLLTRPECPHCGRSFADVATKSSLFGSHTLETGEPPALEEAGSDAVGDENGSEDGDRSAESADEGGLESIADAESESDSEGLSESEGDAR